MDTRKHKLLTFIVEQHIQKAAPIGSKEVAMSGAFDVSAATIRNEMNELERDGYLFQPHTSAGRVPTNKGYRVYVDHLVNKNTLNSQEQAFLKKRLVHLEDKMDQLIRLTARALADASHDAAVMYNEKEAVASGIANLLQKPEFRESESVHEVAELFDNPEAYIEKLPRAKEGKEITVYIGDETPTGKKMNCSFVVSEIPSPEGSTQYLALIGPTRMNYKNNMRLIRYISDLISGGMLVTLIVINIV